VVSHSVNLKVVSRLREDFFRRVEPGAPANLMTRQGGDVLQRVMGDLQLLENMRRLRQPANNPMPVFARPAVKLLAVDQDLSCSGLYKTHQNACQCAFTGTAFSNQYVMFAFFNVKRNLRQGFFLLFRVNLREFPYLNLEVSLYDMLSAFQKLLRRKKLQRPMSTKIMRQEITIEKRMIEILTFMKENGTKKKFNELFPESDREHIVVTFLAILELIKRREIDVEQEQNFAEIYMTARKE